MVKKQEYTAPTIQTLTIYESDSPLMEVSSNIGISGGDVDRDGTLDPSSKGDFLYDEDEEENTENVVWGDSLWK